MSGGVKTQPPYEEVESMIRKLRGIWHDRGELEFTVAYDEPVKNEVDGEFNRTMACVTVYGGRADGTRPAPGEPLHCVDVRMVRLTGI